MASSFGNNNTTMNTLVTLISSLTLCATSMCIAATPEEEAKFITQVRAVIASKNKDAYIALYCLDGATEKQKASIARDAEFYFSKKYTVLEVKDRDASRPTEQTIQGVRHVLNLESSRVLHMEFTNEMNATSKIQRALGEKEGKLMFALFVPKK